MINQMNKKILFLNIILSQGILLLVSFLWIRFVTPENTFLHILAINAHFQVLFLSFLAGSGLLLILQWFFLRHVSRDRLMDELNLILLDKFSLPMLFIIFLSGAGVEEILFRGVIQQHLGIWLASVLFTVIHFRYLKKVALMIEVFLMGMILGMTYLVTQTIWIPILCHLCVNISTAVMIKKGIIQYEITHPE